MWRQGVKDDAMEIANVTHLGDEKEARFPPYTPGHGGE
jgi:hypothetical protein